MSSRDAAQVWPHPAYRIETDRLVLRCYQPEDAAELARAVAASRAHLAPWMPWATQEITDPDHYLQLVRGFRAGFDMGVNFTYGIYDPTTGEQIGGGGLHPRIGPNALEIGYWIAVHRVREGLATETAAALTRVGFDVLGARRLEIRCEPDNVGSARVPIKLGYSRDGVIRWSLLFDPERPRDAVVHTMTGDELPASAAAGYAVRALDALGRPLLPPS